MRKIAILLLLLSICASSFAAGVAVDGFAGMWQYDMHVNNEDINGSTMTFGAEANLSFPVGDPLALGVDASFGILQGKEEGSPYLASGSDLLVGATVQYSVPITSGTAYAAAGGGMKKFKLDVGENGQINTREYTLAGALLGGGFSYELSPTMMFVGDGRILLPLSNLQTMDDQGFHDKGEAKGFLVSLSAGAQMKLSESLLGEIRGRVSMENFSGSIGNEKISATSFGAKAGVKILF